MKYQAILFDMDGTLLDTLTDMQAAVTSWKNTAIPPGP